MSERLLPFAKFKPPGPRVEALGDLEVNVPIIIRLQGTNAPEGATILKESGLEFTVAMELKEAAEAVVEAVKAA